MSKKYQEIINEIEKIRGKNNANWMNLLRVAFKYDPKESGRIMAKIYSYDQRIGKLAKKLTK